MPPSSDVSDGSEWCRRGRVIASGSGDGVVSPFPAH